MDGNLETLSRLSVLRRLDSVSVLVCSLEMGNTGSVDWRISLRGKSLGTAVPDDSLRCCSWNKNVKHTRYLSFTVWKL